MLRSVFGFLLAVLVLVAVWHVYRNSGSDLLKNFQGKEEPEEKCHVEETKPRPAAPAPRFEDHQAQNGARIPPPPTLKPEWEPAPVFQEKLPIRNSDRAEKADTAHERKMQNGPGAYTVQPGDSLWSISKKYYGSTRYVEALAQSNGMRSGADLRIGQSITLPDFQSRARVPADADHETDAGPGEAELQQAAPVRKYQRADRGVEQPTQVMPPTLSKTERIEDIE
jgi:LysM repeat protein